MEVPESFSIDLGTADVFIEDFGKSIRFTGKGTTTDVGQSIVSPTVGMTVGKSRIRYRPVSSGNKASRRRSNGASLGVVNPNQTQGL